MGFSKKELKWPNNVHKVMNQNDTSLLFEMKSSRCATVPVTFTVRPSPDWPIDGPAPGDEFSVPNVANVKKHVERALGGEGRVVHGTLTKFLADLYAMSDSC